ncbi:uncharacterized protein LOC134234577 [Saccostrea cucullata]|uniref:uncharacterized protein LOC134234577 n=1 Tax=Saccostrea cuccullata TaxID=36930 RepID=UPI002ED528EB
MEALSIIEMIKVKLAQHYVMYMGYVNTKMYTEAVGGQSWSTKIRQTVAGIIRLNKVIRYIGELIPEQQSALQYEGSSLYFPPLILLYLLEILCYKHVDTMRAQTALNDLQTLVHYDIIPLELRDISWQILGICQQVTGNLQAALYSYQQSLRQEPYNKIHTATEMRIQESVFVGLSHIVGTSPQVAMRRDLVDIKEKVENQMKTSDGFSVMVSGSVREGFRLEGSDVDYMFWPNDHRVIWELSQSQYYKTQTNTDPL